MAGLLLNGLLCAQTQPSLPRRVEVDKETELANFCIQLLCCGGKTIKQTNQIHLSSGWENMKQEEMRR